VHARFTLIGFTIAASVSLLACVDGSPTAASRLPSPTIDPDSITIHPGDAQIFNVRHATVTRFDVSAERQLWSECVRIDTSFADPNAIRLVARTACRGLVYVSAAIGEHRSPLVAVVDVR
jgi:hypothetical protein